MPITETKAIDIIKTGKFYYISGLHYSRSGRNPCECDYCENAIKGGCIGKYTGAQGLDLCLKCVSEICKNIYFRGEYYISDTDSDSSEQNTNTNTNTETTSDIANTNTIDDVRKKISRQS